LDQSWFPEKPDPATWERPEMEAALSDRDMTRVFRLLQRIGYSQQRIAALTGQSQPEVSAIVHGRKVMAYGVLLRIAAGLGIPRGLAGMSSCRCPDSTDGGTGAAAAPASVGVSSVKPNRQDGKASECRADGAGELALQTPAGLTLVGVMSAQPLPEGAVRRYLEEGRTMAVVGVVDLAQSCLPGLEGHDTGPLAVLAKIPSIAQITGHDSTSPPLVLLADVREGRRQPA
jgi:transcriptional regulator with XRE-family HTH domain